MSSLSLYDKELFIAIPLNCINACIGTIISITLCIQLCKSSKISNRYRNAQILCSITCVLAMYADISRYVYSLFIIKDPNVFLMKTVMIYSFADALYYIECISFYIIALLRVYYVFKNTVFKIGKLFLCIFITLIIISIMTSTYYCIMVAIFQFFKTKNETYPDAFDKWCSLASIILMICDFTLNSTLMLLFVYKLREAVVTTEHVSVSMLNVMTKHTLLFGFAIITNQLWFIGLVIIFVSSKFIWYIYVLRSYELLVNNIVIYLSMEINRTLYQKICGSIHKWISHCCKQSALEKHRRIHQEYIIQIDQSIHSVSKTNTQQYTRSGSINRTESI